MNSVLVDVVGYFLSRVRLLCQLSIMTKES